MRILLDTNILTRSAQPGHAQHQAVITAVAALTARRETLCLVPQNLYEFWVVATRPVGENGLGMATEDARTRLTELDQAFTILDETPEFRRRWASLIVRHDVKGKAAHDARLVAAMEVHSITALLTLNEGHFARYPALQVLTPDEVALEHDPRGEIDQRELPSEC
jgi:predicted nucleic acid-binding protein